MVSTSFGVDTTIPEVRAIVAVVRAYLAHPDSADRRSTLWSTRDPADRRWGDISATLAYQGVPGTILGVLGTDAGDSLYVVKTLYASADSAGRAVSVVALQRVYAVREGNEWRLSNSLPRVTRGWRRLRAGHITYWYEPGQQPHPTAVRRAGRFVDSVAALFGVQPPARLDYYVTSSADAVHRILGLDFFVTASGPREELRGLTLPRAGMVFSGNPTLGDSYLHELVHAVLGPFPFRSFLIGEGIAIWLGGSQGRSYHQLIPQLRRYQADHPSLRLEELLHGDPAAGSYTDRSDALRITGAMFVAAVYRRHGAAGLRALNAAVAGTDSTSVVMRRELPEYATDLDRWWRTATAQ